MEALIYGSHKGGSVELERRVFEGHGGALWTLRNRPGAVAKVYDPEPLAGYRQVFLEKTRAMLAVPPAGGEVVWPAEMLGNRDGFAGFVAPMADTAVEGLELLTAYRAVGRPVQNGPFALRLAVARALADAVAAVHQAGHLVANFSPESMVPHASGRVALVHVDTFQIADATGKNHPYLVAPAEYLPPEAQWEDTESIQWTATHDHFALAVHIFQWLTTAHPFAALQPDGSPDPDSPLTLLRQDLFPHDIADQTDLEPSHRGVFQSLPTGVRHAFRRAFVHGSFDPGSRPSATEWQTVLAGW